MSPIFVSAVLVALSIGLLYAGRAWLAWVLPCAAAIAWWSTSPGASAPGGLFYGMCGGFLVLALTTGVPALRRATWTRVVLPPVARLLPRMSETERVALEAGTVWWDGELFSGRPDWKKLADHAPPGLSVEERAFLEHEVEQACRLCDPEEVDRTGDLSPATWEHLKRSGFFGMIIPKEFGGLGFSAEANSAVVTRTSSHNVTLGITVMVPNSLGPAELLLHYGTDEQKERYLPKLARGDEVPAFALTEPNAGSDAGGLTSRGVVCMGRWKNRKVLGLRLDWDKRYITLAPVATLLGVAFKAYDPDGLLGGDEDLGITCALVPANLPGVETGRRHDPLGVKFINGPTTGRDVFVPLDQVIGGQAGIGQGWRMLMDCLSAGRSLSLPGLACGGAEVTSRAVSAYALVREQFGMPIGRFEGVEEKLAQIYGRTWLMDAARLVTAGSVATGEKPSVLSAIVKWTLTEEMRKVVNDGMDVQAGAGICRGPRNVLARFYQVLPIGVTVEGANILTRTLIVFGQGALRCHPYAFDEVRAVQKGDVDAFDRAFWGHVGHAASLAARAFVLAVTGGRLVTSPFASTSRRHVQRLGRLSAAFALLSEGAMVTIGGDLKRRERITGRLADGLAWLYLGSCAVKRHQLEGEPPSELPLLNWSVATALRETEAALRGVLTNLPNRPAAWLIGALAFPLTRRHRGPSDTLEQRVVHDVHEQLDLRSRLTAHMHLPDADQPGLGRLDRGFQLLHAARAPRRRVREAVSSGQLPRRPLEELLESAVELRIVTERDRETILAALAMQEELIAVDAYDAPRYLARCGA